MLQPASIKEYMDNLAKSYQEFSEGKEKTELWKKIKKNANKYLPNIDIEEIDTEK
ncbi:hypothetical protein NYQ10_10130 [Flavobacterium johnsoniae]|uniref:hypothetical protein n=1 Tax=Flavobacterium johnsoniae TaxID=986 RepID=UPI0025B06199|nr:hypothetical protein [Flavobacterium johnsoniae]WJS96793.1 hypothetical protein NYQ10_10130 [Flavobacterium johnsoniae]